MKQTILVILVTVAFASCCGQSKTGPDTAPVAEMNDTVARASIRGCWRLRQIVTNKHKIVRDEESPDSNLYVNFNTDGTFSLSTDCNTICGNYTTVEDSISLKMVQPTVVDCCDHAEIENMLRRTLPTIETMETVNDSIVRLCTNETNYLELKKLEVRVKCAVD